MSRAYFVSDIHLKNMQERNGQTLLRFLHSLRDEAQKAHKALLSEATLAGGDVRPEPLRLFLVGDIFDLWIGQHAFFIKRFKPIVDAIHTLIANGAEVHYFEGNHDLYLPSFWESSVGAIVHGDHGLFDLGPLRVRVEHGDLINLDDRGYLFLRWFLRTPFMAWLARKLPSFVVAAIGARASGASRMYTSTAKELPVDRIRALVRAHARREAVSAAPFDLLISGHVHVVDDFTFESQGRAVRSINLGSWYDEPKVLLVENGVAEFIGVPTA